MGIEIDALALENWFDLLAFLPRSQLGQLALTIGNRRLATIVQTFLHKYVRQITLRPINVLETTNENVKDHPKARVILWKSYIWGREEFPVADWPMPENITNFESIHLSYLDLSVLRHLQQFQQNSLFTNVNLHITTKYSHSDNASKIAQCLSHLLPLIGSIDSVEFQGCELIDIFIYKFPQTLDVDQRGKVDYTPVLTRMFHQARVLDISSPSSRYHFHCNWLCHWLYTPRDDRKAKVLILLGEYFRFFDLHNFVNVLKRDFLLAKEAVSYFIGIQTKLVDVSFFNIPLVPMETLTNSQTNERITCKKGQLLNWPNKPELLLITRHPLEAAQEWIDANEKEILERKRRKQYRKIELNGSFIGIGPIEPPNLYTKLVELVRPARTPKYKFSVKPRIFEFDPI